MLRKILQILLVLMLPAFAMAQTTTSSMSGVIKTVAGEPLVGATITATHEPTGTVYKTQTRTGGRFDITNMNPGGPYTVEVSFVNFNNEKRSDVYLNLGETYKLDLGLKDKANELTEVVVSAAGRAATSGKGGTQVNISSEKLAALPTVGRNITDYLRAVPQARLTSTEGAISIAGQNNRYNAFYIDGALNNDVFGLAASGTNGGQANIPPISLDAIDQIQVAISPYDASLSGFTGGGVNAITKSGTNQIKGTAYYLFRNQSIAGKTPTGWKSLATRLPNFQDNTYGLSIGGPIVKNKVFYFINGEIVRFERPQSFDTSRYGGVTKGAALLAIRDTLLKRYGYEPGLFIDNPEKIRADRVNAKIDWSIDNNNKFTITYRYNKGERYNVTSSSPTRIQFYNNGYLFPTRTSTFIGELRSVLNKNVSNRLLLTYADVLDDRQPIGQAFPRVTINDGSTANQIIFGPDNSSTINLLTQKNYNLLDIVRWNLGKHVVSAGIDAELNDDYNAFIQNTFGNYTYNSLSDFYTNAKPASYSVGYSLIDNKQDETTAAAAKFKTGRIGLFVNDEYKPNENLTLNFALRADKFAFLTTPAEDSFTNNVALPKFAQYYDLKGARSGLKPKIPVSVAPRVGFTYRIPEENITIRGGAGYFTGRIPLVWPAGIFNSNGKYQGGFTASGTSAALNTIRFRSDPFNQWRASDVGITLSKGGLNLISSEFKLPKIFRTNLAVDKRFGKGWTATAEAIFTKNVNEIYYTNINILPPTQKSLGPGPRTVYAFPDAIPITSTGTNPYDNAILMSNATDNKGFSYNVTFSLDKRFQRGFSFNVNYSYGESIVLHEQTSSVNLSQWRFVETVNGRNYIDRSFSDFSPGHRIFAFASKKFTYAKQMLATTISLVYTGQSGAPFSYVYSQASSTNPGAVRDDPGGSGNDLIYIPTTADIQTYLANNQIVSNTIGTTTYTPAQQAAALETYIQNNRYLNKHRGRFADRNGDRLPFTHLVDLRIAQDFNVKFGGKKIQFQVTYDIFNFTNFLNRSWGRTYFLTNDNLSVLQFVGYVNAASNLTPQYRFNPTLAQPQTVANVSTSSAPSFSPRWTSQLGFRINF